MTLNIGYFADGPWSHKTFDKLINDAQIKVSFICVRFGSKDETLKNYAKKYSIDYLENKNAIYVINWNMRALNPSRFDSSIYENVIEYNSQVNYGLEVNYKLFNYFQFAQQKCNMRLDGGTGPLGKIR